MCVISVGSGGLPASEKRPSGKRSYRRPRQSIVLPKNPEIHTKRLIRSCTGISHHLRLVSGSCKTNFAVLHAASARKKTVTAKNGHSLGATSQSSSASGRGLVKICPQ